MFQVATNVMSVVNGSGGGEHEHDTLIGQIYAAMIKKIRTGRILTGQAISRYESCPTDFYDTSEYIEPMHKSFPFLFFKL